MASTTAMQRGGDSGQLNWPPQMGQMDTLIERRRSAEKSASRERRKLTRMAYSTAQAVLTAPILHHPALAALPLMTRLAMMADMRQAVLAALS